MYLDMDKSPRNKKPLGAARDFLHCVIREQRAATDELLASNRELETLLDEVLSTRADMREAVEVDPNPPDPPTSRPKRPVDGAGGSISQLKREVDLVLEKGGQAIRDSSL